jgi:hypothetical protein
MASPRPARNQPVINLHPCWVNARETEAKTEPEDRSQEYITTDCQYQRVQKRCCERRDGEHAARRNDIRNARDARCERASNEAELHHAGEQGELRRRKMPVAGER